MAEYDEVERYRRLLEDWQPGGAPAPSPKPTAKPSAPSGTTSSSYGSTPSGAGQPRPTAAPAPSAGNSYARGTILDVGGQWLVVYVRPIPEKNMHLALVVCPNGVVKTQGILLDGQRVEELGAIPPNYFEKLQAEMRWNRDLLVFHCYRYEDTGRIPALSGGVDPSAPTDAGHSATPVTGSSEFTARDNGVISEPPAEPAPNGQLRRGQRLHINFGKNAWDAVYWGKDAQGQVVAHKTYEKWALMHLDLDRFKDTMKVENEIDLALVREIEEHIGA